MTNREWLMKQMQNMSDEEIMRMVMFRCDQWGVRAGSCEGRACDKCRVDWLKAEHKEKPKLSEVERVILENVDKDYKWIVRDEDKTISVFTHQPDKMVDGSGFWCRIEGTFDNLECFNHLFQFIKWSDNEPYNIEELLK